jgi:hypothetical protein
MLHLATCKQGRATDAAAVAATVTEMAHGHKLNATVVLWDWPGHWYWSRGRG